MSLIKTSDDPKLLEKWKTLLERYGITDSYKLKWMAHYCENHMKFEDEMRKLGISPISTEVEKLIGPFEDIEAIEVVENETWFKKITRVVSNLINKIFRNNE